MALNPEAQLFIPAAAAAAEDAAVCWGAYCMWSLFGCEMFHLDVRCRAFYVMYLLWLDDEMRRMLAEEAEIQTDIEEAETRADMEKAEILVQMEEAAEAELAEARPVRPPCRYGAGCRNASCKFDHGPWRRNAVVRPPCRYGAGCRNASCKFDHGR